MASMDRQQEFVLRTLEERDIRFVRLWFTDVSGYLKAVAVAPAEIEAAFAEGIGFDGSAIEGFARIYESDMLAKPDPGTFQVMPALEGRPSDTARMFCDVTLPDGSAAWADPRHVLRRALGKAADHLTTLSKAAWTKDPVVKAAVQSCTARLKAYASTLGAGPVNDVDQIIVTTRWLAAPSQQQPTARRRLASPLNRGANRRANHFIKQQQVGFPAARAHVKARHDDGAELEALGLVDGHDLEVVVRRVDVGERVEALERVAQAREVGDRAARLELLKRV